MKQKQYKRLEVLVTVNSHIIDILKDENYNFNIIDSNTISMNYHEFDVAIEDYNFENYKILLIIDNTDKVIFNKEDL